MDKLLEEYIKIIFGGLTDKVNEVANLITKAPDEIFAGDYWENLLKISSLAIMPFALALLGFFIAAELYEVYCKANGELDLQLVSVTVFRFIVPFFLVIHAYDIMQIIFTLFNGLLKNMAESLELVLTPTQIEIDAMIEEIHSMNFFEQLSMMTQLTGPYMAVTVMGGVVFVIVYGRLFEIMLYWLVAPLPLATITHQEHSQIAKGFLKIMAAVMLQGVLMLLCISIYAAISASLIDPANIDMYTSWNLVWPTALLIFTLIKSGSLAKRICGTF